jgi:DNA modification methylase
LSDRVSILHGDCREVLRGLPDASVQVCVTSPPYWGLRDYGVAGQIGLEPTPELYVEALVGVFREVRRVLRDDGTLWLNLGDSYAQTRTGSWVNSHPSLKPKDLSGIPWRVAFALQADGWWLRSDIIWAKPNPMPESVRDRPTKAHEYVFMLSKRDHYCYNAEAIAEPAKDWTPNNGGPGRVKCGKKWGASNGHPPHRGFKNLDYSERGRNKRSVWTIATTPYSEAHFAVMPQALVEPCILAGSQYGDAVLDPFSGASTVGLVALKHGRRFVGVELNAAYVEMSERRLREVQIGLQL